MVLKNRRRFFNSFVKPQMLPPVVSYRPIRIMLHSLMAPIAEQFAPATQDKPDFFEVKDMDTVISIKAETHNFPTTVEPFNGAATGSGGEIRDRLAGGTGSLPIAGTAVYMTSYPPVQRQIAHGSRQQNPESGFIRHPKRF